MRGLAKTKASACTLELHPCLNRYRLRQRLLLTFLPASGSKLSVWNCPVPSTPRGGQVRLSASRCALIALLASCPVLPLRQRQEQLSARSTLNDFAFCDPLSMRRASRFLSEYFGLVNIVDQAGIRSAGVDVFRVHSDRQTAGSDYDDSSSSTQLQIAYGGSAMTGLPATPPLPPAPQHRCFSLPETSAIISSSAREN